MLMQPQFTVGSRGANGVVLITTKTSAGRKGLSASVYKGIGQITDRMELLNTPQYIAMRREAIKNDGTTPPSYALADLLLWDTTRYTNWQDKLLGGSSDITNAELTLRGGNQNTSFSMGGAFHKETMIFSKDLGYNRTNANLNLHHLSDDHKFSATVAVNYGYESSNLFNDANFVMYALTLPPNAPALYDENGELNWEPDEFGANSWKNPYSLLKRKHESSTGNLVANSNLTYELMPGVTIKSNLGYTFLHGSESIINPIASNPPIQINQSTRGTAVFGTNDRHSWIAEPQLIVDRDFNLHSLEIIIGATFQKNGNAYQSIHASGYTSDALLNSLKGATDFFYAADDNTVYKYAALFARIGYSFNNKYLLNISGRRDGSSRFAPGRQFGNFGAVGAAWIFSREHLIADHAGFLTFGKLRGSYGTTGNDQIGDYQFYNLYTINNSRYENATSLSPASLFNPDFGWETTNKFELAIEMGFLKNRISTEVAWYQNRSSSQLTNFNLPATTGFPGVIANLDATIENKGWEFLLSSQNIATPAFQWTTAFNFSLPQNKLIEFPGLEESSYARTYKIGEPLAIKRLYTWTGIDPETGLHTVLDVDDNGVINDSDKRFMKPDNRRYYGGVNNTLTFKRIELSFFLQIQAKNATRYTTAGAPGRFGNQAADVLDRWQAEGDISNIQKFSNGVPALIAFANATQSDYHIEDASFIKVKTVSLSYYFPSGLLQKIGLQEASVFAQAQNLATFTNYKGGFDPETGTDLPPMRMITLGLSIKL